MALEIRSEDLFLALWEVVVVMVDISHFLVLNQGLALTGVWCRKYKCPLSDVSAYFCSFEGQNKILHQTPVHTQREGALIFRSFVFRQNPRKTTQNTKDFYPSGSQCTP